MPPRITVRIYTCPEWDALPPRQDAVLVGKSARIIFHHTAGHHAEIGTPSGESVEESKKYARDIQRYHMVNNGWADSGHNFLVCRNGTVLQGRWTTVSAIQRGLMVVSAHCPGQNGQIGIEHEHYGTEEMTRVQKEASAQIMAWIAWKYKRATPLPVDPHSKYFSTACPANLKEDISGIRARAAEILRGHTV